MFDFSGFSERAAHGRITLAYVLLVIILVVMLGGALPSVLFVFGRNALWGVWALLILCVSVLGLQLSLSRLMRPVLPLVAWLLVFAIWGTLCATYPILASSLRLLIRFICIMAAIAIVTSHHRRLAFFANATQWGLVGNLLVTWLLITYPEYQQHPFFLRMNATIGSDRFAGLWGDANQAGLVALFMLALSYWAKPWIAWAGRISGTLIIYLTASRTAFWIAIALALLHLVFAATVKSKLRAVLAAAVLIIGGVGYLNSSKESSFSFFKDNPTFSRVFDVSESKTKERGEASRVDLAKQWLAVIAKEPWYGYGLYSSEGDTSIETQVKRGFPTQGTHNMYMAIWVDTGWVGLSLFLITLGIQLYRMRRVPLAPPVHRMLFALCFIMLIFALTSHQMLTDYTGWMGFSLIFLLPMSPALRTAPSW